MLERLVIAAGGPTARRIAAEIAAEFPSIAIATAADGTSCAGRTIDVDLAAWTAPDADPAAIDADVERAAAQGPFGLRVGPGVPAAGVCVALLTRCQRHVDRRNRASATAPWERVLERHRALHDLARPLVRADFEHALDTWQWLLRLAPDAGLALQAAALLHDIERLESEATVRVEHRAPSYDAFKDAHARRGAAIARGVLASAGVDAGTIRRAASLVERHERPGDDAELALLNEADALSFFSLNISGFVDYYGLPHARMKVARSLARLGPRARGRVLTIRYRPDVHALVRHALRAAASQPAA